MGVTSLLPGAFSTWWLPVVLSTRLQARGGSSMHIYTITICSAIIVLCMLYMLYAIWAHIYMQCNVYPINGIDIAFFAAFKTTEFTAHARNK